jgi:hypothetical protein
VKLIMAAKERKEGKKEFKEFEEPKEKRWGGRLERSHFNAYPKTAGISPYHSLRPGKVEATERLRGRQAAPENYPAPCFDPLSLFVRPIKQPNAGSFPGAACF